MAYQQDLISCLMCLSDEQEDSQITELDNQTRNEKQASTFFENKVQSKVVAIHSLQISKLNKAKNAFRRTLRLKMDRLLRFGPNFSFIQCFMATISRQFIYRQ